MLQGAGVVACFFISKYFSRVGLGKHLFACTPIMPILRPKYLEAFWILANWDFASANFAA